MAGGSAPLNAVAASQVAIGDPPRVAVDAAGNVYFGSLHSIFKLDRTGGLSRMAGNGRSGSTGNGAPALAAQFQYPDGIAVDTSGTIYVADKTANVVRKIGADRIVRAVAGSGAAGYGGDGGPAVSAQLNGPTALALDSAGNVYIADTGNNVVRRVTPEGVITTFAGNGTPGYTTDGVPASTTTLNGPQGLAFDAEGNLYIADTVNDRVRVVTGDGTIFTAAGTGLSTYSGDNVAGTGITSSSGDGGPATQSSVVLPTDVAVDKNGNLYIADFGNSKIRVVTKGIISTLIGNQNGVRPEENQTAASIRLAGPTGIAVDAFGNVYLTEGSIGAGSGLNIGDNKIWKISPEHIFSTAAGNGVQSDSGDGGAPTVAQLNTPANVAVDGKGNVYIADSRNNRVRKLSGGSIVTIAGTGVAGFAGDNGLAVNARLNNPTGVAVDNDGNIYISDTGNNRIRWVTADGSIFTIAGNGNASFFGDDGIATKAAFHSPGAIVLDGKGNLIVADTLSQRVRQFALPSGIVTTIAGNGLSGFSGDGGSATSAQLNRPAGIALDGAGNLYIADTGNNRVRKVSGGNISTVAGNASDLSEVKGVTADAAGNVFLTDSGHNRIRQILPNGSIVTIAGTGDCCYSGDGGQAAAAQLNAPWGIAADANGNIYVADSANNAVRVIQPVATAPALTSVANAASNIAGAIAPGEVVVISGAGLGPPQLVYEPVTTVRVNGILAPIVYASNSQVSAVVPFGVTGTTGQISVQYQNLPPVQTSVPLALAAPGIFTADYSGRGQALAINQDGSTNGSCQGCAPAASGSLITLYATGAGQTTPAGVDGQITGSVLPQPLLPVIVTVGNQLGRTLVAAAAPGAVAGIIQIQVQLPSGIAPGPAVPVSIQVGGIASQTVTIAIQ